MQPHVLACKSFIMGTCNLLIIGLPAGWRLGRGPFPPEVDHWRDFGGVTWAQVGRGSYEAIGPAGGPDRGAPGPAHGRDLGAREPGREARGPGRGAGEPDRRGIVSAVLRIQIDRWRAGVDRPAGPPAGRGDPFEARLALHRVAASGRSTLGGHEGTWALGELSQGFGPWRRPLPALALASACPATGRRVRVVVECPSRAALEAMLEANRACWSCH
ncbi:MAG TPA: hypothetical protein VF282_08885 [Bacillota bacterium]